VISGQGGDNSVGTRDSSADTGEDGVGTGDNGVGTGHNGAGTGEDVGDAMVCMATCTRSRRSQMAGPRHIIG
jgi:hypothetical protein